MAQAEALTENLSADGAPLGEQYLGRGRLDVAASLQCREPFFDAGKGALALA